MAEQQIHGIDTADWADFQQLMRDYRGGRLGPGPEPQTSRATPRPVPPTVVCLMGNLDAGNEVDAIRMVYRDDVDGVDIQVLGALSGLNGQFQITFEGHQTEPIPYHATAQELGQALYDVIGDVLIDVTLGNDLNAGYVPIRWRLALRPKPFEPGIPQQWNLSVQQNFLVTRNRWHGTGEVIPVHSAIPVGHPTPLRCGAQGACLHFPGAGYGVVSMEARKYTQMYFPTVQ
ncbi:MAG TPA: hypothetical protein VNQ76_18290 [Planctomicrobium sp.]|nr:hypothetical protein [Planctomicrobium sp.]